MSLLLKGMLFFVVLAVASIALVTEITVFNYTLKLKLVHNNKEFLEPFVKFCNRVKKNYINEIEIIIS